MEASSGPYLINRLALQLEMQDGRLMHFYCSPQNAAGAMVTITTETQPAPSLTGGAWDLQPQITFTIEELRGYVMTLRDPQAGGWEPIGGRKGIEQ